MKITINFDVEHKDVDVNIDVPETNDAQTINNVLLTLYSFLTAKQISIMAENGEQERIYGDYATKMISNNLSQIKADKVEEARKIVETLNSERN